MAKIKCLIRKKEVNVTKEEKVRQSYLGNLLYSMRYPENEIEVEVPIADGRDEVRDVETGKKKRADIVIYEDDLKEDIKIIVEVKKEKETDGEKQVKSYGNKTNARYLVWHNGSDPTKVWKRITKKNSWTWKLIPILPQYGSEEGDKIPKKSELKELENPKGLFQSINDYIWVNSSIKNHKEIFLQFVYVLFIKLYDEYFNSKVKFYILDSEYEQIYEKSQSKSFEKRILDLFNELITSPDFKTIFDDTDKLSLEPIHLAEIVYRLQYSKIRGSDKTGEAFQLFVSPYYRGENDQYLTPEPVIKMMLQIVKPSLKDVILDPACGTGRFLIHTIAKLEPNLKKQNLDVKNWATSHIFGIDVDKTLVKISKIYMVLVGDGHTNIVKDDSLKKNVDNYDAKKFSPSKIVTNPPFGSKQKVSTKNILSNYDLGHVWDESLNKTSEIRKKGQNQGVLMLERSYQFLKNSGMIAIVLPDGIFSNMYDHYIRKWIVTHFQILAIISLPEETFRVEDIGVNVKTSVLIAKKKKGMKKHEIFFGLPKTIGYNIQNELVNSNQVNDVAKYYHDRTKKIKGKYFRKKLTNDVLINRMDANFHSYDVPHKNTVPLGKYCDMFIGNTPGKKDYLNKGKIKILKVRCLTNKMIDWSDNQRDYVTKSWYDKKEDKEKLDVEKNDIILAAAAHYAKYVGDEIDIIEKIPKTFSEVIASAKIFVIRVTNSKLNPYQLLLFLRTQKGYDQIQSIIRGQTAEIYHQDFEKFRIPKNLHNNSGGKTIQQKYLKAICEIRKATDNLSDIDKKYGLIKHGNIKHTEYDDEDDSSIN